MKITKFLCMAMAMLASVNLFTACDDDDEDEVVDAIEEWGNNEIQKAMVDGLIEMAPYQASHCISILVDNELVNITPLKTEELDVAYDNTVTKLAFALNGKIFGYTESIKLVDEKTIVADWQNSNTILNYGGVSTKSGNKYSIEFDIEADVPNGNLYYQYKNVDDADDAMDLYFSNEDDYNIFMTEKATKLGLTFEEFVSNRENYKYIFVAHFQKQTN